MQTFNTYNIDTNEKELLPQGKADFLIFSSIKESIETDFLKSEDIYTFGELPKIQDEIPSPTIITRAVHNLNPFSALEVINLEILESLSAKDVFAKGMDFGKTYEIKGSYLILGSLTSTQATSTTTNAIEKSANTFEELALVSDTLLMYCAGFLLEASRRFHVVLTGDFEMLSTLLIADKLREVLLMRVQHKNITLSTSSWFFNENTTEVKQFLSHLSYQAHTISTHFSFENTEIDLLKKYDDGDVKKEIGISGALAYANTNSLSAQELLNEVEIIIYTL